MGMREKPLIGLVAISIFYTLGVIALVGAMIFNSGKVGMQMAVLHGVPALAGMPIILLSCIIGSLIAFGLYNMTAWGYWLTLLYAGYLLTVSAINKDYSLFGNIIWPLVLLTYLLFRRRPYFTVRQSS